jgi:small subunit ribosomal protein S20
LAPCSEGLSESGERPVDTAVSADYDPAPVVAVGEAVANHKSAKKRARQTLKRTARNRHICSGVKSATRKVRVAVDAGDSEKSGDALKNAEAVLRRAASKGAIPKKRASRQISRLTKSRNQLASS